MGIANTDSPQALEVKCEEFTMDRLGELECRVLSVLQEAGEENIAALVNTVLRPDGSPTELYEIGSALVSLIKASLVCMALHRNPARTWQELSNDESVSIARRLNEFLTFRAEDKRWTWSTSSKPHVLSTEKGGALSDEVLSEYGYRWWLGNPSSNST